MPIGAGSAPAIRHIWAYGLIVVFAVQTLARLLLFSLTPTGISFLGVGLHVSFLANLSLILVFVFWIFSLAPGRRKYRSYLAVLLLAGVHAAWTVFDVAQAIFIHLTGQPVAMVAMVRNVPLTLSLLDNVGISPSLLVVVLGAIAILHALAYLAISSSLRSALSVLARARFNVGPLRLWFAPVLLLAILSIWRLQEAVPIDMKRNSGEPIYAALQQTFQIAPEALLAAAKAPPGSLAKPAYPAPPGSRPVVLIVVDALRRDHMGLYNPQLNNTPFLSSLEYEGRLQKFDAYSTCTFSFCGMMSILASSSWNDFGARPTTLVERLHQHSYDSHLILAGQHASFGSILNLIGRGATTTADQPRGQQANDKWVLATLQGLSVAAPKRTFLYLHLMSAHAGAFIEPAYRVTPDDQGHLGAYLFSKHGKASYREIYDGRVRQSDDVIRRAFSILRDKGMLDDALIIITADHGQRVAEGGALYHGGDADPATLNIPLLVVDPRRKALPPRNPASQIDVAPTVTEAIGIAPAPGWRGTALQMPSSRPAVPVGTQESTGAVVLVAGRPWLYLCRRENGKEQLVALGGGAGAQAPDLRDVRRLHLKASAPVRNPLCRERR
ncbi:MAG TPA: sulfatase-like hydrolase/transferase [Allosphingosinicella sp.]|jgi:glucan phosphoethanolaminetransferase (alkaline phosphatase superfamily)